MERIYAFLFLFAIVLFLEAIGGSYMVSAIQSIERQFQIPSKLSGFMVSASDIGYIPTVIFISYFGSKGNRAKWIGAGTIVTALSYLLIASPNFIYPVVHPKVNLSVAQSRLIPSASLLRENVSVEELIAFAPVQDRIPSTLKQQLIAHFEGDAEIPQRIRRRDVDDISLNVTSAKTHNDYYTVDGGLLSQAVQRMEAVVRGESDEEMLRGLLQIYVKNRANYSHDDLHYMKRGAHAPFSFCGRILNELRGIVDQVKCTRTASNFGPFVIMFTALIALGVGRTMPWSLGVPMIDDNVKRKSLPAYFAGISFIRILGPIIGYLIGSFSNKLYYTLKPPPGLTAKDPTWIGAWWLGFLVVGCLLILPSFLLYFFPSKSSKGSQIAPSNGTLKVHENGTAVGGQMKKELSFYDRYHESDKNKTGKEKLQAFRESYREVTASKVYVGSVIGRVLDMLAFRGYMVFLPKYLENHYGIPQYKAHQLMAMFGVFGFALGTMSGGFITRHFKLNGRRAPAFVLFVSILNILIFFLKIFIGCNSVVNSVGINGAERNYNYTTECNADCGCGSATLFPVCNPKGFAFFSPCHAGCREVRVKDLESYQLEFSSCDCSPGDILKKEYCQDDCKVMIAVFFVTVMAGAFAAGNALVPGMLILLRSIPQAHRSISLGLQGFLVSLFATLPSPFLWGVIFDSACLVWNQSCSGGSGACAIYDPSALRVRAHLIYCAIRTVSAVTDAYVVVHAKNINILEEKEEEVVESKDALAMQATSITQ